MIDGKRILYPVKEMTRMRLSELRQAVFDRPQWRRMVKMVTVCELGLVGKSESSSKKERRKDHQKTKSVQVLLASLC